MDWKESDMRKSPKVREIVGQMPPMLARYGIAVIVGSLLMTCLVFAVMPYRPQLPVVAKQTLCSDSSQVVSAVVPSELYNTFPKAFSEVGINRQKDGLQLLRATEIGNDEDGNPVTLIELEGKNNNLNLDSTITIFHLGKVPLLSWMLGRYYFGVFDKNHNNQ
ncbi:MAG: hypothetical protein IJ057_13545 [Bacteroidales bacterium]|nr:hypothetical protein [Bacteroidales bacterium]MBQ8959501.1 hypothetical protein [Bacteroidales bacterium]